MKHKHGTGYQNGIVYLLLIRLRYILCKYQCVCLGYRIPQLLTCLVRNEGRLIMNLLSQVGRMYPQAVYFPIRTLYLTLKIEQRERCKLKHRSDCEMEIYIL